MSSENEGTTVLPTPYKPLPTTSTSAPPRPDLPPRLAWVWTVGGWMAFLIAAVNGGVWIVDQLPPAISGAVACLFWLVVAATCRREGNRIALDEAAQREWQRFISDR